jgi:hypothetical protein
MPHHAQGRCTKPACGSNGGAPGSRAAVIKKISFREIER